MRTVDVGIRHNNDFAVTEFGDIKFTADTRAERKNDRNNLRRRINAVEPALFDVEDFAAQRENGLKLAVPPVLGCPAGRISLNEVQLGILHLPFVAVGQL